MDRIINDRCLPFSNNLFRIIYLFNSMITVVFPYLHSYAVWDELRFTLRSLCANLNYPFQVMIFGDIHPGLQDVNFVEMENISGGDFSKAKDAIKKMRAIVENPSVSDDFLYWYDDIVLLSKIDRSFFDKLYALNDLDKFERREHDNYKINLWRTYDVLKYNHLKTINYETHLPHLFNKKKMKFILDNFCPNGEPLLINSLYHNYFRSDFVYFLRKNDKIKAGFYGLNSDTSFDNTTNYEVVLPEKIFCNYNNKGLNTGLKKYIIGQFPKFCKYEK